MKRLFALLLAISVLLSLTLPAYAEEAVEEVAEEIVEEVIEEEIVEEVIEEEITEEVIEEVTEEAVEEVIEEEIVEEVVEEIGEVILSVSDTAAVSAMEANGPPQDMPNWDDPCPGCGDGTIIADCRNHWGTYGLWMHQVDGPAFLSEVTLWVGDSITVKMVVGNHFTQSPIYFPQGPTDAPLSVLTLPEGGLKAEAAFDPTTMDMYQYTFTAEQKGTYTVGYTNEKGETFSVRFRVLGEGDVEFYASDPQGRSYYSQNNPMQLNTHQTLDHKFYIRTMDGITTVDPAKLYNTTDSIIITPRGDIAQILMMNGAKGFIKYDHTDGRTYSIPALSYGADQLPWDSIAELLATDKDGQNLRYSESLSVGATVQRVFRIGSAGASVPVKLYLAADGNVLRIVSQDNDLYTIEAVSAGTGWIGIATNDGSKPNSVYTVEVSDVVAGEEMFFVDRGWDPSGNQIKTYLDSQTYYNGNPCTFGGPLWFGTKDNKISVPAEKVTLRGNGVVEWNGTPWYDAYSGITYYNFKTTGVTGYGELVYAADNGLEYVMPIKVYEGNYDNSNRMVRNFMEYTDANGNRIEAGIGRLNGESMDWVSQFGAYFDQDEDPSNDMAYLHTIGLLLKKNGVTVHGSELKDVRVEILSCNDNTTDNLEDMVFTDSIKVSPVRDVTVQSVNLNTKVVQVTANYKEAFSATIAFSYTYQGRRFTQQIWAHYNANGDVTINADDLTDSGKLNVVLSSWDALTKWAKEEHGKTIEVGNFVNIYLPVVNYEDIIVAQAQSPYKPNSRSNPISSIRLHGMNDQGKQATMVGLIEKCCLQVVHGITFVADPDKTMTTQETGNKKFTCGILADYTNTTKPVYDTAYLNTYCGGQEPSLTLPYIETYKDRGLFAVPIDIGQVSLCNFYGFDYGVRSTLYGHVGAQGANSYHDCYYGIYINNDGHEIEGGDPGGDAGNESKVNYSNLVFNNNMYAVRIESIPHDASPYNVRVTDSNFIDNFREFWIDEDGLYYCYRNYFAGKWHENNNHHGDWREYKDKLPQFDQRDEEIGYYYVISEHRPGRVHYDKGDPSKADTLVIVNPSRKTSDMNEDIYWFYGGEDQTTIIESGDNSMLISGEAVAELESKADVSVVNNGKTEITYTFHGKGGKK